MNAVIEHAMNVGAMDILHILVPTAMQWKTKGVLNHNLTWKNELPDHNHNHLTIIEEQVILTTKPSQVSGVHLIKGIQV